LEPNEYWWFPALAAGAGAGHDRCKQTKQKNKQKEHSMKVNKWTLGLAAVGMVSLPAVVQADEKPSPIMTALASTTISGYVNTSAQWDIGNGTQNAPGYAFNQATKQDGFNLNAVKVAIEKPLDESEWSAGYKAELVYGSDANALGTTSSGMNTSDFAIKQAFVAVRAPLGNGLDVKMGVFDTIIGYETFDAGSNPNFSRSWGYTIEPTTHTGLLATYRFAEWLSMAAGVANTYGPTINGRATTQVIPPGGPATQDFAQTQKSFLGSIALTAPKDMGFLAGSTLYSGVIYGFNGATVYTSTGAAFPGGNQTSVYVGGTMNTPVTNLKVGACFDYVFGVGNGWGVPSSYAWAIAGYASFQATEKLSFHGRGEYAAHDPTAGQWAYAGGFPPKVASLTGTVQYDLWKNVLSRVEFRWDHACDGSPAFGGTAEGGYNPTTVNAYTVMANLIYNF
jgi:hypothetical protein